MNNISKLRTVLKLNAAFSALSGLAAVLAGPWVSEHSGIDHVTLTRLAGVGLVVFAVDVAAVSRSDERRLVRDSLFVSVADLTWVGATIVVLTTVQLTSGGVAAAVLLALAVADFAGAQLWFRSKLVGSYEAAIVAA
jgi:hypothetical protein